MELTPDDVGSRQHQSAAETPNEQRRVQEPAPFNRSKDETSSRSAKSATVNDVVDQHQQQQHQLEHEVADCRTGRLMLGAKCGGDRTYFTRYRVDDVEQTRGLCRLVMLDECVPCCDREELRSLLGFVWSAVRSELFVVTLHLTSLTLGAMKETSRQTNSVLTIVDTSFETIATLLLILIRIGNAYFGYREVQHSIRLDQNDEHASNVHVRQIRKWMCLFIGVGLLLFCISLGFFILFLFTVRLGWTILTNNFSMVVIQVLSSLYRSRVTLAVTRIYEDQHKVVIGESILFLRDARCWTAETTADSDTDVDRLLFVDAVEHTELFAKPAYITLCQELLDNTDSADADVTSMSTDVTVASPDDDEKNCKRSIRPTNHCSTNLFF